MKDIIRGGSQHIYFTWRMLKSFCIRKDPVEHPMEEEEEDEEEEKGGLTPPFRMIAIPSIEDKILKTMMKQMIVKR